MTVTRYFQLVLVFCAGGCATQGQGAAAPTSSPAGECSESKDRAAIAAMAGSYHVTFDFEETEVLDPKYEKFKPKHTDGTEWVTPIENAPGRVSLQHILTAGTGADAMVIKHWRQDWVFQDRELLEFQGRNVWLKRTVDEASARCTWTQQVFEVDDTPRYEGIGRWVHDARGSVWQSNETYRPLPRREYTKRSDYDVLIGVNRHRITNAGWQHEQDNQKLVLEPRHLLVRETGINRYARIDAAATEPAAKYWQETSAFWALVRQDWASRIAGRPRLELSTEIDGKRLYDPLFERLDDKSRDAKGDAAFIHQTIGKYVRSTAP